MSKVQGRGRSGVLLLQGRGTSPGSACGPLKRNRPDGDEDSVEGSILVAERATPDDVGRILVASGTLTFGGALLSHVSLLSREFNKASVSLGSASLVRFLSDPDAPGVLELSDVVGDDDAPVLDEGDVVLLDGDRGTVRVPGGIDPVVRRHARDLHRNLRLYASSPERDDSLAAVVDSAGDPRGPVFLYLLEAAFLNRIVPAGEASRRLTRALTTAGGARAAVDGRFSALRRSVVQRSESRFLSAEVEIRTVQAVDDLDRTVSRLQAADVDARSLLADLGGDPSVLDGLVEPILKQAAERREALRSAISSRVLETLDLPDELLRQRFGGYLQLLRHARGADLEHDLVVRLDDRLREQMATMRARVGDALVVPIGSVGPQDRGRVGGKAAGLLEVRAVLPERCIIPDGFVVAAAAFKLHVLGEVAERLQAAVREGDAAGVSRRARAAILSAEIPEDVARAVEVALEDLDGDRFAVRSSASVEDGAATSFAGQFDTALGVSGLPEILQRVRQTWASLWNARALRTMAASGVSPLAAIQAVLVQEMVATRTAGVLVTREPAGRPDMLLINAAWGLGEGISQGDVPGDLYWVQRSTGELIRVEPGEVSTRIMLDPDGTGTLEVPLDSGQAGRPTLTTDDIDRLAELARVLETATGRAQDVEFGLADDGTLVVFQVRRVATARRNVGLGE